MSLADICLMVVGGSFIPSGLVEVSKMTVHMLDGTFSLYPVASDRLDTAIIMGVALFSLIFLLLALVLLYTSHQQRVVSGLEEMVGSVGEALEDFDKRGRIRIHSENWQVVSTSSMVRGQLARVIEVKGLVLKVEPIEGEE